ncbi:hypothetical protein [Hymenobacter terrenus]|uniref:hypothetical protein n=1 Tax=Hymenobacter terrenus TaxID=1629124 RepID=UPI0006194C65|nr:hypothetical protein [Hymenobacter terrenus]
MAKDKKKHSKKDKLSDDIMDAAVLSLKKFRKVTKEIGRLSTGQKLVGGIALLAAGLTYLAKMEKDGTNTQTPAADPDTLALPDPGTYATAEEDAAPISAPEKPRKTKKSTKSK